MEALQASYGGASSDSDSEAQSSSPSTSMITPKQLNPSAPMTPLPPLPLSLLNAPNTTGTVDYTQTGQASRVRSFPHVQGNYALHVFIPVYIPTLAKRKLAEFLRKAASLVPGLHAVDVDIPIDILCKDDQKLNQVALGREFHISLGRTVPIQVHQIDSIVTMLRQKLQSQRCYWIDFSRWEVFVNDDKTRSFLSIEVIAGGLTEITKQIRAVNEVYQRHNLPEFYKDPRPHLSIAWTLGDISNHLKGVVQEEMKNYDSRTSHKHMFSCKFSGIKCRIGDTEVTRVTKVPISSCVTIPTAMPYVVIIANMQI